MKYTETHEWIDLNGDIGTVGITRHAAKELGDIVYVELPKVGREVKAGDEVVVLESTKAAADGYAPVTGVILEVNEGLKDNAGLINTAAEKEGWLFKIKLTDLTQLEDLLDFDAYEPLTK